MHVLFVLTALLFAAATPFLSAYERRDVEWSEDADEGETLASADVDQNDV